MYASELAAVRNATMTNMNALLAAGLDRPIVKRLAADAYAAELTRSFDTLVSVGHREDCAKFATNLILASIVEGMTHANDKGVALAELINSTPDAASVEIADLIVSFIPRADLHRVVRSIYRPR